MLNYFFDFFETVKFDFLVFCGFINVLVEDIIIVINIIIIYD